MKNAILAAKQTVYTEKAHKIFLHCIFTAFATEIHLIFTVVKIYANSEERIML